MALSDDDPGTHALVSYSWNLMQLLTQLTNRKQSEECPGTSNPKHLELVSIWMCGAFCKPIAVRNLATLLGKI